jgi:rod shape-determining protein MreC
VSLFVRLLTRYRGVLILTSSLVLAFLLITLQVRHERAVVAVTRQGILLVMAPFIKVTAVVVGSVTDVWHEYVDLRNVQQENRRLRQEAGVLSRRIEQLEEQTLETQRLQRLLALREVPQAQSLTARVSGKDATNWFKTILVDRGGLDGVRRNQAVVAPDGLVGRVVEVTPASAKVQLLTDPVSAVGGLVQRTRVTGIISGNLGEGTRVRYLPLMADVAVGDLVVTSGMGGVFPKGIPIGRITTVERRSGALFQDATLQPTVDLSRLEEVLILTSPPPGEGFEAASGSQP